MAIGFGRAIASALGGTVEGLAEAAVREDEKRDEVSKVVLAQRIKNSEKALELSLEQTEALKEENDAVSTLMKFQVNGKPMSRAEATEVYRASQRLNIDPVEVLEKFSIESEEGGQLIATPPKTRKVAGDETAKMMAEEEADAGFIRRGRAKSVDETATKLLRAAGYSTEIEIPQAATVTGVKLTRKKLPAKTSERTSYLFDDNGQVIKALVTVTKDFDDGTRTYEHFDATTNQKVTAGSNQQIGFSQDAFKKDQAWKTYGQVLAPDAQGNMAPLYDNQGKPVFGYQMKDGSFRLQQQGGIGETIARSDITIADDNYIEAVGGDLKNINRYEKLPGMDDFRKEQTKMRKQASVTELLIKRTEDRMKFLNEYGDDMYGLTGVFSDFVSRASTEVSSIGSFVDALQTENDEFAQYALIESNQSSLRDAVENRDTILESITDRAQRIATARVLDSAAAALTAYDLAKATGDTRISNQDFNAFIQTVKGTSAAKTRELLKARMNDAYTSYKSQYTNLEEAKNGVFLDSLSEDDPFRGYLDRQMYGEDKQRHPNNIKSTIDRLFEPPEGSVSAEATDEVPAFTYDIDQESGVATVTIAGQSPLRIPLPPQDEPYTEEEVRNVLQSILPQLER